MTTPHFSTHRFLRNRNKPLFDNFSYSVLQNKMGITTGLIVNKKGQIVKKYEAFRSNGTPIIKAVLLEEAEK